MYDWDEITGNSSNSIGYVNFVDEKHEFVSTHYIVNGIPVVKVSLSKSADDTLEWLYEYLYKLYKEPLYSSESEVQEQYGKLFTDIDKRETPQYIWKTDRSCIAVIHWYNSEEYITQYYIKTEPVK